MDDSRKMIHTLFAPCLGADTQPKILLLNWLRLLVDAGCRRHVKRQVKLGGHSELVPLLPIPNRTVKRLRADDSVHFACESRSLPSCLFDSKRPNIRWAFCFCAGLYGVLGILNSDDLHSIVCQVGACWPRCAHPVIRFSIHAKISYIAIAITEMTITPANISAVLSDELADIIR